MLIKERKNWHKMGCLENGDGIFCNHEGEIAIEKSHFWLVTPNGGEMLELKKGGE